eukprot:5079-Heterococcus_DN1.PRE.4
MIAMPSASRRAACLLGHYICVRARLAIVQQQSTSHASHKYYLLAALCSLLLSTDEQARTHHYDGNAVDLLRTVIITCTNKRGEAFDHQYREFKHATVNAYSTLPQSKPQSCRHCIQTVIPIVCIHHWKLVSTSIIMSKIVHATHYLAIMLSSRNSLL